MILLVDDDPSVLASLGLLLDQHGYSSAAATGPREALSLLEQPPECRLVIQDMNFSRSTNGEEGLELIRQIKDRYPTLPVVLLTAWGSIELAVEGMKVGAADFLTKPWNNRQLLRSLETALAVEAVRHREDDGALSRSDLDHRYSFDLLLGEDPRLLKILDLVGRVSATDASVLITGESGTGKELVADAIHRNSARGDQPFVKVNLGGISSTLFESEMFGHARGAFTDAKEHRRGRFEIADGGSIFLDEIAEVEPSTQVKLLRVLQDRTYEVLGSSRTRRVDVRVISATNRDLAEMVANGGFREDLLYRLNLISVELPPLRNRRGDIRLLAEHFLSECCERYRRELTGFTGPALDWLLGQSWPGNVRQLKQVVERAVLVGDGEVIDVEDLVVLSGLESRDPDPSKVLSPKSAETTIVEMERRMIEESLERSQGNVSRAARALGLSRAALYRRCDKYGLKLERS